MPAHTEITQAERDKLEINPDIDFRAVAARPFSDLSKAEIGMFKWSGVYHQLQPGFFMIRLRIPGGLLTAPQLRRAGDLARDLGRDRLCITTRQCLQFHWIRQQDICRVIEGMAEVGILTTNACGDVCRNVTGCALQGVCRHEIGDTRSMLRVIADDPELLREKRNLPRKHKISVAGCGSACGYALMNCQGWHPVIRKRSDGSSEAGWRFYAGGGLGSLPRLARRIFDWVPDDLVLHVARAAVEAHNRFGNRRKRRFARLKIVVDTFGAEGFGRQLLELMRERNVRRVEEIVPASSSVPEIAPDPFAGHGVIPQRDDDVFTVRTMVPRSEFTGAEASFFADVSERFGDGTIMLTQRQNLRFPNVSVDRVAGLLDALHAKGYRTEGFEHLPDIVSCVGTTLCNLAVSDTPDAYRRLTEALRDESYRNLVGPLRINMNGCPNSCGHHWIADIGLRGRRTMGDDGSEEGFSIYAGGRLDGEGRIAEHIADVSSANLVPVLRSLLDGYLHRRQGKEESFGRFAERLGASTLSRLLAEGCRTPTHVPVNVENARLAPVFARVYEEAETE